MGNIRREISVVRISTWEGILREEDFLKRVEIHRGELVLMEPSIYRLTFSSLLGSKRPTGYGVHMSHL